MASHKPTPEQLAWIAKRVKEGVRVNAGRLRVVEDWKADNCGLGVYFIVRHYDRYDEVYIEYPYALLPPGRRDYHVSGVRATRSE